MWKDPAGLLRKMWSAQPWKQRTPNAPDCWQRKRDEPSRSQPASTYFSETFEGAHCQSNWFEGNKGSLGGQTHTVQFTEAAPAVLGFDETIDQYCGAKAKSNGGKYKDAWPHARQCIEADVNILSLYGNRVPYNICRNLEWMVCAAKGSLPGQGGDTIVFSLAPSALDPSPTSNKPFGMCRGYTEADCKRGYATDSIYFLEVCIFDQICENSDELWAVREGQPFHCRLSRNGFDELQKLLLETPDYHAPKGAPPICKSWCTTWNCGSFECLGCKGMCK